jgi:N-methylhydantoinase B
VTVDPFTAGVVANRLASTLAEQQATLVSTAFSTIVRESLDLACGVFDTRGEMVAQSLSGTPGHINSMATGVRHFVEAFPPDGLEPGDVLVTNDPWLTAGQVNDLTVVTPIFRAGRLVAFFASTCHSADIGGRVLSGEARDVFEEGLQIPIVKLASAGRVNEELLAIVRANVRTPGETVGDLYAQMAANEVGGRSLLALLGELGLDELDPVAAEITGRSEHAMRDAIGGIPNGVYEAEAPSDGFDEDVFLRARVTVEDEDLAIDFAGSSPESPHGINLVFNYTHAYASFAVKAAIAPDVPHNAGSFRPVHVSAPPGSVLNCLRPAPVASRHLIGHLLPGLIFRALAPALPGGVIAGSADALWLILWSGRADDGAPFSQTVFQAGGMGARAVKDGLSAIGFPSGVGGVPAEVVEALTPLVQRRRELRADSGGAGRWRGGLGQVSEMTCRSGRPWSVSALVDRTRFPAPGLDGGGDGAAGEVELAGRGPLPPKRTIALEPDARVVLRVPGGGGYGDPFARDPERVLADVVDGYVSIEAARELYGVVIRYSGAPDALVRLPRHFELDEVATDRARRSARR